MAILRNSLPFTVWMDPRLPGIRPMDPGAWLRVDEVHGAQTAERVARIAAMPERVHALLPQAAAAASELLGLVVSILPGKGLSIRAGFGGARTGAASRWTGRRRSRHQGGWCRRICACCRQARMAIMC